MKTKAQTLAKIGSKLSKFYVPKIEFFTVGDWTLDRDVLLTRLATSFDNKLVGTNSVYLKISKYKSLKQKGREYWHFINNI